MSDLGVPHAHPVFQLNQLAFAVLFFVCRVLLNVWMLYKIVHHMFLDDHDAFMHKGGLFVPVVGTLLAFAFAAINLHWFRLILRARRTAKTSSPLQRSTGAPLGGPTMDRATSAHPKSA